MGRVAVPQETAAITTWRALNPEPAALKNLAGLVALKNLAEPAPSTFFVDRCRLSPGGFKP